MMLSDILGYVLWAFIFAGFYASYWLPFVAVALGIWLGMELEYE